MEHVPNIFIHSDNILHARSTIRCSYIVTLLVSELATGCVVGCCVRARTIHRIIHMRSQAYAPHRFELHEVSDCRLEILDSLTALQLDSFMLFMSFITEFILLEIKSSAGSS